MKNLLIVCVLSSFLFSCNKCYDCTRKCGTCVKAGAPTLAGCTGDPSLNGFSVDSWKTLLESPSPEYGYTCSYANIEEEACGKSDKENKEKAFYDCVSK
jgi:hypothetical protein